MRRGVESQLGTDLAGALVLGLGDDARVAVHDGLVPAWRRCVESTRKAAAGNGAGRHVEGASDWAGEENQRHVTDRGRISHVQDERKGPRYEICGRKMVIMNVFSRRRLRFLFCGSSWTANTTAGGRARCPAASSRISTATRR